MSSGLDNLNSLQEVQKRVNRFYGAGDYDSVLADLPLLESLAPPKSEGRRLYFYASINIIGFRSSNFSAALELSEQAIQEYPQYRDFWFFKGRLLSLLDRDDDALTPLLRAIELAPEHGAAGEELQRVRKRIEQRNAAQQLVAEAAHLNSLSEQAQAIYQAGDYQVALKLVNEILESVDVNSARYRRFLLIRVKIFTLHLKDYESASKDIELALKYYQNDSEFLYLDGLLLADQSRWLPALHAFKLSFRNNLSSGASAYEIGKILHRFRRRRMAAVMLKIAKDLGIKSNYLHEMLALNYFYIKLYKECLQTIECIGEQERAREHIQRLETLAALAIQTRANRQDGLCPPAIRHIAIAGVPYIGSTLLGSLLGSLPNAGHGGETEELIARSDFIEEFGQDIDFDLHPTHSYGSCRVCGSQCRVLTEEYRSELLKNPIDFYAKLAKQLGISVLITGDKGVMHKERRDPLFEFELLILYKSPLTWTRSNARQRQNRLQRGEIKPEELGDVHDWLRQWVNTYDALLALPIPRERVVVVNWDRFVFSPYAHFSRLIELLNLEGDASVFENIDFGHFIGGNGQSSVSDILAKGRVTFKPSDAPELSDAEEEIIRSDPMANALAERLKRRYDLGFSGVDAQEGEEARRWSPKAPKRGRSLDVLETEQALKPPLILPGPFAPVSGYCFQRLLLWPPLHIDLRDLQDTPKEPGRSPLVLFEDGRAISRPHALVSEIASEGGGLIAHTDGRIYFSTSDNSDPNLNGREYSLGIVPDYKPVRIYRWNTVAEPMEVEEAEDSLAEPVSLITPFQADGGFAYFARINWLPQHTFLHSMCDNDDYLDRSPVLLLEDGTPLASPHSRHQDIRHDGDGRYSHWGDVLYFSASDNSNPNSNGRIYSICLHIPSKA